MSSADLGSSVVQLLATQSLGLPLIALAADVVAADARFNHWVALEGKRILKEDQLLEIAETYESLAESCRAELESFIARQDGDSLEAVLGEALQTLDRLTANAETQIL